MFPAAEKCHLSPVAPLHLNAPCPMRALAGENAYGVAVNDEELLATSVVHHVGQAIGVVIAVSRRCVNASL